MCGNLTKKKKGTERCQCKEAVDTQTPRCARFVPFSRYATLSVFRCFAGRDGWNSSQGGDRRKPVNKSPKCCNGTHERSHKRLECRVFIFIKYTYRYKNIWKRYKNDYRKRKAFIKNYQKIIIKKFLDIQSCAKVQDNLWESGLIIWINVSIHQYFLYWIYFMSYIQYFFSNY